MKVAKRSVLKSLMEKTKVREVENNNQHQKTLGSGELLIIFSD